MKTRPWRWVTLWLTAVVVLVLFPPSAARSQAPPGENDDEEPPVDNGPPPATPPAAMADVRSAPPVPRVLPLRSLSTSKQFIIFADSGALRLAMGLLGEEARDGVRRLLGPEATERWKVPIVVDLRRPAPDLPGTPLPSRLTLAQTGLGLKIQLELLLGDAGRAVRPRTELARALLLEIAYRDAPGLPAGRPYLLPPAWLVEGVAAYLDTRADETGALADGMTELLGSPRAALPLDTFLACDPAGLDTPSLRLYRAYAYGLLRVLTEEVPGGRAALLDLLRGLPQETGTSGPGPGPLLARLLTGGDAGRDPAVLEAWWTTARARFAEAQRSVNILSVEETERRLAALLSVTLPTAVPPAPGAKRKKTVAAVTPPAAPPVVAGRVVSLEEFVRPETLPGKDLRRAALAPVRAGLLALLGRAHPFYRPILAGYEATLAVLARGGADAQRTGERLHLLAVERATARTRSEAIADYLNWYEATQPSQPSDAFEGYFQAARQNAANEHVPAHHRADPISAYLDAMEAEY